MEFPPFLLTSDQQFVIAQIAECITFVYGLVLTLAPQRHLDLYTTEKENDQDFLFKSELFKEHVLSVICQQNLAIVTTSTVFWLLTLQEMELEPAIGISTIPWLVLMLHFALNKIPQRHGNSPNGVYMNIAMFAFVVYATLMATEYSSFAAKLLAGFAFSHGVFLFFSPITWASFWGNVKGPDFLLLTRRCVGANLVALGVFYSALIGGMPLVKACGVAWGVAFLTYLMLLGDFKTFHCYMPPIYVWLGFLAFFAVALSIHIPLEVVSTEEQVNKDE